MEDMEKKLYSPHWHFNLICVLLSNRKEIYWMNDNFNYNLFINKMIELINNESNQKVAKALNDSLEAIQSMNNLNEQEKNKLLQCLFTTLCASQIN